MSELSPDVDRTFRPGGYPDERRPGAPSSFRAPPVTSSSSSEGRALIEQAGVPVGAAGPGDFFGEVALLDGDIGPRTAAVVTAQPMRLLVVRSSEFGLLLREHQISCRIAAAMAWRLLHVCLAGLGEDPEAVTAPEPPAEPWQERLSTHLGGPPV